MKKITTILFVLITAIGFAQNVPVDFEGGGNGASWTWNVFENDTNPPLQIIANPDPTGANTSATVAEFTALQTGMPFAGVESMHGADIGTWTLDASNAIVKIMVWKPVISNVGVKLVNGPGGSTGEILVANTVTNTWEELTFDFSGVIGNPTNTDLDQIVIFPDFDARTQTNIVYFDNITFNPVPAGGGLPLDFEGAAPTFNDFNGSFTQVIANPDPTGVNTSANVAENTVPANAAFAGVNIAAPVDITTDKFFRMDVWSPLAGTPVLLKLEGGPNPPVERQATLSTTGAWEEVIFDFSSEGAVTYDSVTIFMNFNVVDPATQTYYWDNLELYTPGPPPVALPLDFEGAPPTFNDFNGSFTQVIANPDPTGVNTSANVAENTVPANAAFAGVNIAVPVDITTDKFFRMDVWSPLAGTPVLLKLEGGPNPPVERQATLSTTGAWEEVIFDFSSEGAVTYDSVTIFMNFNVVDPATQTYYWDNLELYSPPPPALALPLTFEAQTPIFNDFNGSFTQIIANPDATGINTSANVAENTVPANAAFAGVNIAVPVDITTDKFFRMDVWSPLAGTPVLLKLEGGPNPPVERQATLITTGAWEEVIFDFSSEGALTYDSVTIFMNFNVVDPATQTYYWDNLELYSPPPPALALPLTFEAQTPIFNDFNGSFTQIIANPDATGINTSANVAENTVPANAAFAGVNIAVPVDITTDKFFRMDVWSPLAGTPVLLKLEGGPNPPVERQATLSTTGVWEEVIFDFSSEGALTYDSVTIFMNFNVVDPASQTYYWDNLELFTPPPPPLAFPITFEGPTVGFNDFNGSFTQVIANPDATGVNTSANVAENTVPANAAFAGVNIVIPVDITTDKYFAMDVWSPIADTPVLLKLEGGPNPPVERQAMLSTSGAWEEIFFDFSSEGALTYDSVTIFMNFNVVNPASQTYYWDNLEQINALPGPVNDLCVNAITINCGDSLLGTTLDATDDTASAPTCDTTVTAPGVWYVFEDTTGLTTDIVLTTCSTNTDYDTKISVYTGDCAAPPLTCVAGNDDDPTCPNFQSSVEFQSDGASTYYILVHGFGTGTGNFELSMTCALTPPPNDLIVNALDISALGTDFTDPMVAMPAATLEGGNPSGCNLDGAQGVWYKGIPTSDGTITGSIITPGGFSSITLYEAPNLNAVETDLVLIDWFENQCLPGTSATAPLTTGQAYYAFVANTEAITDISFQFVAVLGVEDEQLNSIDAYPNPVSTYWNVQAVETIIEISVHNLLGQSILQNYPNSQNSQLDLSSLKTGVYIATVKTELGSKNIRIIKN